MLDPLAVGLKFIFVVVLYLFVLWVARSSLRDLSRVSTASADPLVYGEPDMEAPVPIDLRKGVRPELVVVAARGIEPGERVDLLGGATMGRGNHSDVVVDDPFASNNHARIFARGPHNFIEDLGSTNATYLNGQRLDRPEQLEDGDTVRIGDTEYRYEE